MSRGRWRPAAAGHAHRCIVRMEVVWQWQPRRRGRQYVVQRAYVSMCLQQLLRVARVRWRVCATAAGQLPRQPHSSNPRHSSLPSDVTHLCRLPSLLSATPHRTLHTLHTCPAHACLPCSSSHTHTRTHLARPGRGRRLDLVVARTYLADLRSRHANINTNNITDPQHRLRHVSPILLPLIYDATPRARRLSPRHHHATATPPPIQSESGPRRRFGHPRCTGHTHATAQVLQRDPVHRRHAVLAQRLPAATRSREGGG